MTDYLILVSGEISDSYCVNASTQEEAEEIAEEMFKEDYSNYLDGSVEVIETEEAQMHIKTLAIIAVSLLVGILLTLAATEGLSMLDSAISEYCQNR